MCKSFLKFRKNYQNFSPKVWNFQELLICQNFEDVMATLMIKKDLSAFHQLIWLFICEY